MLKVVIDTCIFAKLFLDEKDNDDALKFFHYLNKNYIKIIAPSLFEYEILAVCARNNKDVLDIKTWLDKYKNGNLFVQEIDKKCLEKTQQIIRTGNKKSGYPSFYDAIYHSLAIINDCDFVTVDKKYYEKTKIFGHIKLLKDLNL